MTIYQLKQDVLLVVQYRFLHLDYTFCLHCFCSTIAAAKIKPRHHLDVHWSYVTRLDVRIRLTKTFSLFCKGPLELHVAAQLSGSEWCRLPSVHRGLSLTRSPNLAFLSRERLGQQMLCLHIFAFVVQRAGCVASVHRLLPYQASTDLDRRAQAEKALPHFPRASRQIDACLGLIAPSLAREQVPPHRVRYTRPGLTLTACPLPDIAA